MDGTAPLAEVGFGPLLRRWRTRRRLSQLDLAVEANVSTRHLSFIETGRASPNREMVLLLSRLLDELLSYPDVPRQWRSLDLDASTAPFLPIEFARDGLRLRYFTTLTSLGTPHDITLQELRIESFFPADEATEEASRRLSAG